MFMGEVYHLAAVCRVADGQSPTGRVMPRERGGIQYAAARRLITDIGNYWIIRFRG
jgi:hypothetical protein